MEKTENSTSAQRAKQQIKFHLDAAMTISEDIGEPMLIYILRMANEELVSRQKHILK